MLGLQIKACMGIFKNLLLRILSESRRDKMSTIILVPVLYWQFLHNKFFIKKVCMLGNSSRGASSSLIPKRRE